MEVKKTIATSNKTASTIDFSDEISALKKEQRLELLEQIGELLVEETLASVADSRSPVNGGEFKSTLSKAYAKKKLEETGSDEANLDLTGSMLSSLDYRIVGDLIELGVYGSDASKADGHNNFSGKSKLPPRQFLPDEGESYNSNISSLINQTIQNYLADNVEIDEKKLEEVETKQDLYELLADELGDYSRKELKSIVMRSDLASVLNDFDLLDLL